MGAREFANLSSAEVVALPSNALVVQPIGAIEQHGPHLPLVTDALIAEEVARRGCEATDVDCFVLPTLSYGRSGEHRGFPGTVSLSTLTLMSVCMELGRSIADSGFRTLMFVNGHGGQPNVLETVARDIRADCGLQVVIATPMRYGVPSTVHLTDAEYGIHAGQAETSVMLALAPELVHLDMAERDGELAGETFAGTQVLTLEGATPTAWLTEDFSFSGVLGDPSQASVELGRDILDHWVAILAVALLEASQLDLSGGPRRRSLG